PGHGGLGAGPGHGGRADARDRAVQLGAGGALRADRAGAGRAGAGCDAAPRGSGAMSESATLREVHVEAGTVDGAQAPAPAFRLAGSLRSIEAEGCLARLPAGPAATLGARVQEFFAAQPPGPSLLVGALPFD